jgi:hypothetical protein
MHIFVKGMPELGDRWNHRRWIAAVWSLGILASACVSGSAEPTAAQAPFTVPEAEETTETPPSEPKTPETTTPAQAYRWQVGDCVDLGRNGTEELPYAPYGTELLVNCTEPHTHEVYFTATLDGGPDAPYPEELGTRLFDVCLEEFAEFMGFPSSDSTLEVILYLPDADEWAAGERYHACVVYQTGATALYEELIGSTGDNPEVFVWRVDLGACYDQLDLQRLKVDEPVDCAGQHTFEMVGETIPAPDAAEYPGPARISELGQEACDALLEEYAAQPIDPELVMTFSIPLVLSEGEWDAGKRTLRCFAFAAAPDAGLLTVTGSLGDGTFEIVGTTDDEGITA